MSQTFVVSKIETNAATPRRETLNGREYLAVPAVAIVAGVLNGMLAPGDEIAAFVEAWNGRPFVMRHPQDGGQYISANSPTVLEDSGLGFLFNAQMDADRLRCELWMDVAKAQAAGGDALAVLQRFEAGKPVELSTGYYCDIEPAEGQYNGKPYSGIQRNIRPDHIAALPDEEGACSWQDGCGAPRVNAATKSCSCGKNAADVPETGKDIEMSVEKEAPVNGEQEQEAQAVTTPVVETPIAEQPATNAPVKVEVPAEVRELAAMVKELGGVAGVKTALQTIQANAQRMRADLVARLVANRQCAFSAEQMATMPIDHLEALERSLRPADYSARSGMAANAWLVADSDEWEEYVTPVLEEGK